MSLKSKIALAFAIVYVVWGSTYLAIRVGLESMPPLLMAGVRFLIAGGLLWAWCDARREPRPTRAQGANAAVVGLCLVALGNGLVTVAEQSVPSGLTAVLVAVGPVFMVLLSWARGSGPRPDAATTLGLGLGLAGVSLLVVGDKGGRVDPFGAGLIVAATFAWSCGVVVSQTREMPASSLRSNAVQMLVGGTAMLAVGAARGEVLRPDRVTLSSALALGYLIVFGAIVAYSAYGWLLRHVSAAAIGTTAYVNPGVAVVLGAFWGERIELRAVGAMTAILLGVWLLRRRPRPAQSPVVGRS